MTCKLQLRQGSEAILRGELLLEISCILPYSGSAQIQLSDLRHMPTGYGETVHLMSLLYENMLIHYIRQRI